MKRYDAVVVGSGPNGLGAAVVLARAGHSVKVVEGQPTLGGGTRTQALTRPGFQHDLCSAIHPLALGSPLFRELELEAHGVEFIHSPAVFAHPLDDGRAAVLERSVEATAAHLGRDEQAWLDLMKPLVRDFEVLRRLMYHPPTRPPVGAPLVSARFGLKALHSAFWFAEHTFETREAKALLAGCAAHSFTRLTDPMTNAFGLLLAATGHAVGWPLVKGGSQKLAEALSAILASHGGEVELGRPITTLDELPEAKVVLFDTHAHVMERVCGEALPEWYRFLLRGFKRGHGVFKLDYALSGPMPWRNPACLRAATVHLGGTMPELAASEAQVNDGHVPPRPYVLVAQQSLFDATRAPPGQHTLWAYCHVPNGSDADATAQLEGQLERFAPGFRDLVLARAAHRTSDLEAGNPSYVGGDISGGAVDGLQLFVRPVPGYGYATPNPRVFLCSSSTSPGPGVHGMCGYWAAQAALARLQRS